MVSMSLITLILVIGAFYYYNAVNKVVLQNNGNNLITNVKIYTRNKTFSVKSLEKNATASKYFLAKNDSPIFVEAMVNGKKIKSSGIGYVTQNFGTIIRIEFTETGEFKHIT